MDALRTQFTMYYILYTIFYSAAAKEDSGPDYDAHTTIKQEPVRSSI